VLGQFLIATQVPKPASMAVLGMGLLGLAGLRRLRPALAADAPS